MELSGQLHGPAAFSRGKKSRTQWIEVWVCPKTGLEAVKEIKIPSLTLVVIDSRSFSP
jgi:hypothetical protein